MQQFQATLEQQVAERTKALHQQKEYLRAILHSADDAIITIDQQGTVQSVNPATEKLFGYATEEMVGQNVSLIVPSPHRESHDSYIQRYLNTGEASMIGASREVLATCRDGSTFPVELTISHVDHLDVFTGIIRDIRRRKELEQEVVEIVAQEQQRIGQDLHDHAGQELTALDLLVGTLEQSRDPSIIRKIQAGIQRLRRQLRYVCWELVAVDVGSRGLQAALQELASSVTEMSGIDCRFFCKEPACEPSPSQASHIYYIAQEACLNAVKHSQGKKVQIRLDSAESEQRELVLEIEDDGTGLKDPTTKVKGSGLRIMHNRANLIGASLQITAIQPHGALVTCILRKDRFHEHPHQRSDNEPAQKRSGPARR